MKITTNTALKASALAPAADLARRSRTGPLRRPGLLVALAVTTLGFGLSERTPASAADMAHELRVGHSVEAMIVPGSTLCPEPKPDVSCSEKRHVDVHLWYPADVSRFADSPKTVYRSALYGLNDDQPGNPPNQLIPGRWNPLSWQVESEVARENAPIDPNGPAFPVIVFSHGSTNDPVDYAPTLERIAAAGFVVAAPAHVNNTQDDERIDFIRTQATSVQPGQPPLFACRDGRPPSPPPASGCSRGDIPRSMEDRARDISYTLNMLPNRFGDRVDMNQVGVMGHSRGTVTALAAAGGSEAGTDRVTPWGFGPVPGVKAVMGLAIGAKQITSAVDLANVQVPTLLVAGQLDTNPPPPNPGPLVSKFAFDRISSTEKAFVLLPNAVHRSFDSAYCDELKSAGTITQAGGTNSYGERKALLDWHTVKLIGTSFPGGLSGKAHEYCSADTFSNPGVTDLLTTFNGTPLNNGTTFMFPPCRPDITPCDRGVPTTGLDTDEVKQGVVDLAVTFFGTVLKRVGKDGPHFTQFLAPKWLENKVPMVGSAEAFAGDDAICPPGLDVVCGD